MFNAKGVSHSDAKSLILTYLQEHCNDSWLNSLQSQKRWKYNTLMFCLFIRQNIIQYAKIQDRWNYDNHHAMNYILVKVVLKSFYGWLLYGKLVRYQNFQLVLLLVIFATLEFKFTLLRCTIRELHQLLKNEK